MHATEPCPYTFHTFTVSSGRTPKLPRNAIKSRMPFTRCISSEISFAFFSVMPFTVASRAGSSSITLMDSSPNASIIRPASAPPMPFTAPLERYFSIAAVSAGRERSNACARNCCPNVACDVHVPYRCSRSPTLTYGNVPTTVMSSSPQSTSNTVYWLLSLW